MFAKIFIFGLLTFAVNTLSHAAVSLTVNCVGVNCLAADENQTPNIIIRADESLPVTIEWRATKNPVPEGYVAILYAGNPAIQQSLADKGILKFTQSAGQWLASWEFTAAELGRESFITTVMLRNKDSMPDTNNTILDWRAIRLSSQQQQLRRTSLPEPATGWSIDIRPAWLRVRSGHGWLPRTRGNDRPVWWSLADTQGDTTDLDMDGDNSGVAGLTIQVSSPWLSNAKQNLKQSIKQKLTGINGHFVKFGALQWYEQPERTVRSNEQDDITLRHYYTIVTLYTNASVRSFSTDDVSSNSLFALLADRRYFSHETTARLDVADDIRFWSSYSEREYGADPQLLQTLKNHLDQFNTVAGLGAIQREEGDGGDVFYHVGFYSRVKPWQKHSTENDKKKFSAGFVGMDIIAARSGNGGVVITGSRGENNIKNTWLKMFNRADTDNKIDLSKPPQGYRVAPPIANLGTLSGNLPMMHDHVTLAERGLQTKQATKITRAAFPSHARTGVSAKLRAGALIQEGAWGYADNIIPINSYAQFVIKMTVAMTSSDVIVANNDTILPLPIEMTSSAETPEARGFWAWIKKNISNTISLILALALLVLIFIVPGFRQFISSIFKFFAAIINRAAASIEGKQASK